MRSEHWLLGPIAKALRILLGVLLLIGGLLGFLPILGFWMIPLGAILLGRDIPAVDRFNQRVRRWWRRRRATADRRGK